MHEDSGELVGAGQFETAPSDLRSAPRELAIAIMSCNQPFDEHGRPARVGAEMLEAASQCLEQHAAKYVLTQSAAARP